MFCAQCGNKLDPNSRFCQGCGAAVPVGVPGSAPVAHGHVRPQKRRRTPLILALCLLAAGALTAAVLLMFGSGQSPSAKITLSKPKTVLTQRVKAGQDTVLEPSDLDGMKIEIPAGAYTQSTDWVIKISEIKSHKLGKSFKPATPLISIDNGGGFAEEAMVVTLPFELPDGYFATAFYYDRESGALEGIPTLSLSDSGIKIATRHFCDIVVSIIEIDKISGDVDIDTNFFPGTDDWQFPNYGSYAAPGGHCAGQSVSAMWYFTENKLIKGERGLYGRYDNNDYGEGTIDFWYDDSWGYRLASAVQRDINWGGAAFSALNQFVGYDDTLTMLAFAHAMLLTGEPQFVGLRQTGEPGGHAIIAYRLNANGLYVADPNFPGDVRLIPYKNGVLGPYDSGASVADIASGTGAAYDRIGWYGKTALVDWDRVGERFKELDNRNVGNDVFVVYEAKTLVKTGNAQSWVTLTDGYSTTTEKTKAVAAYSGLTPVDMTGKIAVRTDPGYGNMYISAYRGTDFIGTARTNDPYGVIIPLDKGENNIGILITVELNSELQYVDFQRLNIVYDGEATQTSVISGTWSLYAGYDQSGNLVYASGDSDEITFSFDSAGGFTGVYRSGGGYIDSAFSGTYDCSDSRAVEADPYKWYYYAKIDSASIVDSGQSTLLGRLGEYGLNFIFKFRELDGKTVLYDEMQRLYFSK